MLACGWLNTAMLTLICMGLGLKLLSSFVFITWLFTDWISEVSAFHSPVLAMKTMVPKVAKTAELGQGYRTMLAGFEAAVAKVKCSSGQLHVPAFKTIHQSFGRNYLAIDTEMRQNPTFR